MGTVAPSLPLEYILDKLTVLGKVLCDGQSGGLMGLRSTLRSISGAESSIAKLLGVEHIRQVWEVAMEWSGTEGLLGGQERSAPNQMLLFEPLTVRARLVAEQGKKIDSVGEIRTAGGDLCVSVEAVFIDKTVPRPR